MKPKVTFVLQLMANDDGNEYVYIDAQLTEEDSCGFVVTETVNDIFDLRDAIDAFAEKHQISRITDNELQTMNNDIDTTAQGEATLAPPFTNIVSGYLYGICGEPATREVDSKHVRVVSSQDIVLELADMVDVGLNEVSACMAYLGYHCGSIDGKLGWLVHICI